MKLTDYERNQLKLISLHGTRNEMFLASVILRLEKASE